MATIAFVFARGGSKGISRKNLRYVAGKPLLVHAIEAARAARLVDEVVVSSDDWEILNVAHDAGAHFLLRPAELATDDSPEWLSWQHAIQTAQRIKGGCDLFVSVPCTAPLRLLEDIDAVIQTLGQPETDAVITVTPARHNPYFNQVEFDEDGNVRLCSRYYEHAPERRQDAPEVYDVTTVAYAARPEFVLRAGSIWDGNVRKVVIPPDRAIDIDTELDLRIAEFLMREREAEVRVKRCVVCGEALPLGGYFLIGPAGLSVDFCGKLECGRSVMEGQTNQ